MKSSTLLRVLIGYFAVGLLLSQPISAPEKALQTKPKTAEIIARLEQRIPQLMQDGEVPGLSIALIREAKLVWHHGFGVKNAETKEPVTDSTIFEAASLSKPVFAYAVLKLVDGGKLDLDKPLNQYLPGNYDNDAVGGNHPALAWLHYEPYNSPAKTLLKNIIAHGAETALREYRAHRQGGNGNETLGENQMNRLGYDLLYGARRVQDAIAVFKLNVEDYPQSSNVYDSLGEAYMVNDDKELAIKNYQRSIELNPDNTNGVEALKKLQEK